MSLYLEVSSDLGLFRLRHFCSFHSRCHHFVLLHPSLSPSDLCSSTEARRRETRTAAAGKAALVMDYPSDAGERGGVDAAVRHGRYHLYKVYEYVPQHVSCVGFNWSFGHDTSELYTICRWGLLDLADYTTKCLGRGELGTGHRRMDV